MGSNPPFPHPTFSRHWMGSAFVTKRTERQQEREPDISLHNYASHTNDCPDPLPLHQEQVYYPFPYWVKIQLVNAITRTVWPRQWPTKAKAEQLTGK